MPLYSLYTPSHEQLECEYFTPSVPEDMEPRLFYFDNPGAGGIHDPSFCRAIIWKIEIILQAVHENRGEVFVWSDIDVQFFRPFAKLASQLTADLAFQVDAPGPALCSGFFFCRASERTQRLWENVLEFVRTPASRGDDQLRVRELVRESSALQVDYLSPNFIGGGTFTGKVWVPGVDLCVPEGIIMHHANFTCGVPNKIAQCNLVRRKVADRHFVSFREACELTRTPWLFDAECKANASRRV